MVLGGTAGALLALLAPSAAVSAVPIRFAIGIAQGIRTYVEPGRFDDASAWELPILSPHRILEERDEEGGKWYRLERRDQPGKGWVNAKTVEIWNSRHALRPKALEAGALPGYCSLADAEKAVRGDSHPCMYFNNELVKRVGNRAPFPVVATKDIQSPDGDTSTIMEVLVATLFSNIAPLKSGDSGEIAKTLEVMIFIDATGSMDDEIRGTANALQQVVDQVAALPSISSRFLVVGYRDTDKTKGCAPMESSSGERLAFGSTESAKAFLERLRACEGGDEREMIWDALYTLSSLKVTPGATRVLLLVGDQPAHGSTKGGRFLGTNVPSGIDRAGVFKAIERTIGASTSFVGFLVGPGKIKETVDQIMAGFDFHDKRVIAGEFKGGGTSSTINYVRDQMVSQISSALKVTKDFLASAEQCRSTLGKGESGSAVALFCGETALTGDRELNDRVRDLVKGDTNAIVIRHLWIPWSEAVLSDVALLNQAESRNLVKVLGDLADQAGPAGAGCRKAGPKAWYRVMNTLAPGEGPGDSLFNQPAVPDSLYTAWKLRVHSGESIIRYTPAQLQNLTQPDCLKLRDKLRNAGNKVSGALAKDPDARYKWIPFNLLP